MKIRTLIHNSIYKFLAALMLPAVMPAALQAQSIDVIDVSQSGDGAVMKAEIDVNGKTIETVLTRTFRMADGYSTTSDECLVLDGKYVIANLDYVPGDYFYRMEVTFSDGTEIKTDCYNAAFTEAAVWLSDLPLTGFVGSQPTFDICSNGAPILLDGVTYHKGVSALATSASDYFEYVLPRTFDYVRFVMGVQDVRADGSASAGNARMEIYANGSVTNWRGNMLAKSNPSCKICKFDARWPQSGTMSLNSLKVVIKNQGDSTDDYCNMAGARLYYAVSHTEDRQAQTVSFESQGGAISDEMTHIPLQATASGGTPVYYTIVEGRDIATIENGNVLVPMSGKRGNIVVEAITFGDAVYAPAAAQLAFNFNFAPTVQYLASFPSVADTGERIFYLYVDQMDHTLEELSLSVYDNARGFNHISTIDVLPLLATNTTTAAHVIGIPVPAGADCVHQLRYKFAEEDSIVVEPLSEGRNSFVYMSDLPYSISTGWGSATRDIGYGDSGRLATSRYSYGKGFGFHANGYVATTGDLSSFDRFVVDAGGQKITNPTRGRLSFSLVNGSNTLASTGNVAWGDVAEWDFPIDGNAAVRINGGNGGDGNTNDVIAIGAPRFYYPVVEKKTQSLLRENTEEDVSFYKPFVIDLDVTATSGLGVIYRIVEGGEYARIEDGSKLNFYLIPESGDVVVEALQPGDKIYGPAEPLRCIYHLRKELIVARDERVELEGGHEIEKITVYADALSSGQVSVSQGVVNVKKLVFKYTFVPGEWNYFSFPTDLDLNAISDLNECGYYLNNAQSGRGGYFLQAYDTRLRAEDPESSPWQSLDEAKVTGLKGYIMMLDTALGEDPVEITFTIDNMTLDFESTLRPLHLTLDMTYCEPGQTQTVYIKPANVKGNTLKVNVRFNPSDESALPVNHERALQAMRVTFTPNRKGIRLTLPDQSPARVAIYDRKGRHLVKAVNYVSPMMIDISDVKHGTYQMVVGYGPATIVKTVEL